MSNLRVTVLSIPFVGEEGFDAEPLETFCRDHSVTGWRDHFFMSAGVPHLALILEYRARDGRSGTQSCGSRAGDRESGARERNDRKDLDPADRPLYDRLREWRALRSSRDGVPVYVILNNRQLAEIARRKPRTKAALCEIDGIGEPKIYSGISASI